MELIILKTQKGIALITAILMLVVLSVIGIIAVNVSTIGAKITGNTRTSKQAFYMAEAGLENARELLRSKIVYTMQNQGKNAKEALSVELNLVKGNDGQLVDSTNVANFSNIADEVEVPFINNTSLGNGSYKVYLTNDNELSGGVTSLTDTNATVTLTSFGSGPDNSKVIIQATVMRVPIPNLPGAITLPGPSVSFIPGSSNAAEVDGGADYPAIAVNSTTSQNSIILTLTGPPDRSDQFDGMGLEPSVQYMAQFPEPWGDIGKLQTFYKSLKDIADFSSPSESGFTLGTDANPKLVVIDGNYQIPANTNGSGILLVTGTLELLGNFDYNGIVLVIGKGILRRTGAGNGDITGGLYVANIAGPDGNINTMGDNVWGIPTWDTSGAGNSDIEKVVSSENNALQMLPFVKISWRQLYQ